MAALGPEKLIFVGGAPRSGTTVTHALICTSQRTGRYHPEISFFRGILTSYRLGKAMWNIHTKTFFADPAAFAAHIRETADLSLNAVWRALRSPPVLALKDPHLTPHFPDLHELYPAEARFVTVCRHPYDVVRSRQAVHEKSGAGRPFGEADAAAAAREYLTYYRTVLQTNFGGRHYMFRYEDLNAPRIREGLARFLDLGDLDPAKMWRTSDDDGPAANAEDDAWGSPKYYGPIDLERRLEPLDQRWQAVVRSICEPIMRRMGYD